MQARQLFRSGRVLVSVGERRVQLQETLLDVQPRCFDLMVYLILHRRRAVGRDELVSAVWGKAALSPSTLPQCVTRLRQALLTAPELSRAIRTVSRHGYQWVAPIEITYSE